MESPCECGIELPSSLSHGVIIITIIIIIIILLLLLLLLLVCLRQETFVQVAIIVLLKYLPMYLIKFNRWHCNLEHLFLLNQKGKKFFA